MSIKHIIAAIVALTAVVVSNPVSLKCDSGVGMQFGDPGTVGLSLRFHNTAIGAAWNIADNGYLHVNVDQWAMREELDKPIDWFAGYGVDAGFGDDFRIAARIPVGLIWEPSKQFEVFAQVAPGLKVLPAVDFYFGAAAGVRYRF